MTKHSESITVRLEHKTKFVLDLAARIRHSDRTSVVEQAIICFAERLFDKVMPELIEELYDIDELTRIKKLKETFPHLVSFEEEKVLRQETIDK